MALILNIETSTTVCSVALGRDGKSIALKELNDGYTHSENLTLFIRDILKEANVAFSAIDAIAVSKGPGSYTGLRIGVSTAKGLCFSLDKPLIGINTLQSMASLKPLLKEEEILKDQFLFCPMIDARRMEVYCAFYDCSNREIRKTEAIIVDENSFADILANYKVVFFGDGAEKCIEKLAQHKNAIFADNVFPSAKYMTTLAEQAFASSRFENLAYFEPYYLKEFVGGQKKV